MANTMTSTDNTNVETTYINKRFMDDLLLATQMVQFCTPADEQGKNVGNVARWLHIPEWGQDVSALSETAVNDNVVDITSTGGSESADGTLAAYGQHVKVSNFVLDTAPVGLLDKISKRAADAGARGLDKLAMDQAVASTVIQYAGQAAVATSGTAATLKAVDFAKTTAYFNTVGAHGFDHLGGMFGGVMHPNSAAHLKSQAGTSSDDVTWAKVNQHIVGGVAKIEKGEAGALYNTRLFESPLVQSQDSGMEFYRNICIAKDGIGCSAVEPQGDTAMAKVIVKKEGGTYDPLDTYQTLAWKWTGVFKLFDADRVIQLYAAKT